MIERLYYKKKITPFIDKPFIKVIAGIRRSGKSTFLKLIQRDILNNGIGENQLIYINFESMEHMDIKNAKDLYGEIIDRSIAGKRLYLFFDEIQLVEGWERAVNSFLVDLDVDIYITGSNSRLLSSEISTLLTGRYVEINLFPLSFTEMIQFHEAYGDHSDRSNEEWLWHYIRYGGFPAIHIADYDEDDAYTIISDIYDSVVLKDVVQRFGIRNVELLNRIMKYVMDNVGNTFSAKSISDYFKSQHRKVDLNTVYNYLDALESSFMIFKVNRYELQGKEILKTQEKYYLADQGIMHAVFGYRDRNISGVLENIVYLELLRRGYKVYVGKLKDREVDFVAEKKGEKLYIQVTFRMDSEKTVNREFEPLLAIKDHYPKYVISMDEHFRDNIEGIKHLSLYEFMVADGA
jgi:hypothetical protein